MAQKKTAEEELVTFTLKRDPSDDLEEEGTQVTVPMAQAKALGYVAPKTTAKKASPSKAKTSG